MTAISYDTLLEMRSSRSIAQDYKPSAQGLIEPLSDYRILLDMIRNDPILWTATELTVDFMTINGYDFDGGTDDEKIEAKKVFEQTLEFDQVYYNILFKMIPMGDSYAEFKFDLDGNIKEMYALPTVEMAIDYSANQVVNQYIQRPQNTSVQGKWVKFAPENVMHMRLYGMGNNVYSESPFTSILRSYNSKIYANHFLQQLFRNLHPKVIYFLNTASKEARDEFFQNVIRAKTDPSVDLVARGNGFDAKLLQYAFDSGLVMILDYLRSDVLMVTRVPK